MFLEFFFFIFAHFDTFELKPQKFSFELLIQQNNQPNFETIQITRTAPSVTFTTTPKSHLSNIKNNNSIDSINNSPHKQHTTKTTTPKSTTSITNDNSEE